ncbi:MAG: DUF393 domain-containing protein [Bryobacterales bacterium]|jgi:predicted DCC family thiol-disulfide oxidoreductase YuxK|nr:DUF393 domain-containing protein [Bryobacterales bacterium]
MKRSLSEPQAVLPSIEARPSADVLIYDGYCSFCHGQMLILHRLDVTGRLAYLSLHHPQSDAFLPGMSFQQKMEAIALADSAGGRYFGAQAFRKLSLRMPLLWWLAPLLHIPGSLPVWEWLYAKIASVRYRFGRRQCDGGTCELHGFGPGGR